VRAGAGFSVLPTYLCRADLAAGRITALHDPAMAPLTTIHLVRRPGLTPTTAVTAVHERLLADAHLA